LDEASQLEAWNEGGSPLILLRKYAKVT
jgi:hypothetical protein